MSPEVAIEACRTSTPACNQLPGAVSCQSLRLAVPNQNGIKAKRAICRSAGRRTAGGSLRLRCRQRHRSRWRGLAADPAPRGPPRAGTSPAVSWAVRPGPGPAVGLVCDRLARRRRGLVHRGSRTGSNQTRLRLVAGYGPDRAVLVVSLLHLAGPAVRADADRGAGRRPDYLSAGTGTAAHGPGHTD